MLAKNSHFSAGHVFECRPVRVPRSELPAREVLGARPLAEASAVNGGPQRNEEDLDGAKRAVQSSGTASRAVDG